MASHNHYRVQHGLPSNPPYNPNAAQPATDSSPSIEHSGLQDLLNQKLEAAIKTIESTYENMYDKRLNQLRTRHMEHYKQDLTNNLSDFQNKAKTTVELAKNQIKQVSQGTPPAHTPSAAPATAAAVRMGNHHTGPQNNVDLITDDQLFTQNLTKFKNDTVYQSVSSISVQQDWETYYNNLVTAMRAYDLPITPRYQLDQHRSAIPPGRISSQHYDRLTQVIFGKIFESIPDDYTAAKSIINAYASTRDGYDLLFALMRANCIYLQEVPPIWGPKWSSGNAYTYLAKLNSELQILRQRNCHPTSYDIALEMLQQAANLPEYAVIATTYLNMLMDQFTRQTSLPARFNRYNIANILESNKRRHHNQPDTHNTIHINQIVRKKSENKKQCPACKTYGHAIGDDICRITAQTYFINKYMDAHPATYEQNAINHNNVNNKKRISQAIAQLPEAFNEYQTPEEQTRLLSKMATMLHQPLPSDTSDSDQE